jgi:PKD repeat protein
MQAVDIGFSPEETTVSVDPPTNTEVVGQTFTVNVNVTNVSDLFGWQVNMTFNPDYLNVTEIKHGPFLKTSGEMTAPFPPQWNNTRGFLFVSEIIMPPYSGKVGASGSGTLANVTFEVVDVGGTLLKFETKSTKLNTVIGLNLVPIPYEAVDGAFDNRVAPNVAPVALFDTQIVAESTSREVVFDASSSYDPDAWLVGYIWDFGDGTTVTHFRDGLRDVNLTATTQHVYNQTGTYTVTLDVWDSDWTKDTAGADVTVNYDVAITDLKISHTEVMPGSPLTINVTAVNEGNFSQSFWVTTRYLNLTTAEWVTIDTISVIQLDPEVSEVLTFTWNTTDVPLGTYTISANATVINGETDTQDNTHIDGMVIIGEVNVMHPTIVVQGRTFHLSTESNSIISDFNFDQAEKKISFNVSGEDGTSGFCNITIPKALLWLEDISDDWQILIGGELPLTMEVQENETHTFLYFTYTHSLKEVQIIGTGVATPPVAAFTYSPETPIPNETITFDSTSYDPDGTIVDYLWDFGDGNTGTGSTAIHQYETLGTYTVNLTVSDNHMFSDWVTQNVTVLIHDIAVTDVTPALTEAIVGESISIDVSVENQGDFAETFNVTLHYDTTLIETQTLEEFTGTTTLNFIWNTTGVEAGDYVIKAEASHVQNETDPADNAKSFDGTITIYRRDVAVVDITLSATEVIVGETVSITVSVENQGDFNETFNVTVAYDGNTIETKTDIILNAGDHTTLDFTWDTTGVDVGDYTITAEAILDVDNDPDDNTNSSDIITVQEASGILLYMVIAAVIVVISASLLVYFLKVRKPK